MEFTYLLEVLESQSAPPELHQQIDPADFALALQSYRERFANLLVFKVRFINMGGAHCTSATYFSLLFACMRVPFFLPFHLPPLSSSTSVDLRFAAMTSLELKSNSLLDLVPP
jgi:hypothetical protein